MDKKSLLVIEPTVFIECNRGEVLFYNSLDGKKVLSNNKNVFEFFKDINKLTHVYAINDNELNSKAFKELTASLEKNLMGRIINNSKTPPVQFYPMPKANLFSKDDKSINESDTCLQYLTELSIYFDTFHPNAPSIFTYACKQTLCHSQGNHANETKNTVFLFNVLSKITKLKVLKKVNLLGGDIINIFETKKIKETIAALSQNIEINLHLNYFSSFNIDEIKRIRDNIKHIKFKYCIANLLKNTDVEKIKELSKYDYINFVCLCENVHDVMFYEDLFVDSKASFQLIPIFNGYNFNFFSEKVFLELKDIMGINISQKEVQQNLTLNKSKFGKLFIMPDANVFSDLNGRSLGNLNDVSFTEIVYNEINRGENWLKTRLSVNPCTNCVFRIICPPISNYEYVLQRYNLCHINTEYLHKCDINNCFS